jgi:hypothetical protein
MVGGPSEVDIMRTTCRVCQRSNPAHARFCGACGRPIAELPPEPARTGRFVALILGSLMVVLLGSWIVMGALHGLILGIPALYGEWAIGDVESPASVTLRLSDSKADALHELLAPRDVKVFVGRRGDAVIVRGTPREVRTLSELGDLLNRFEAATPETARREISRIREQALERREFRLPQKTAETLHRLLGASDVPILIHRERTRVEIYAPADDMRVIESIVRILRGERL